MVTVLLVYHMATFFYFATDPINSTHDLCRVDWPIDYFSNIVIPILMHRPILFLQIYTF